MTFRPYPILTLFSIVSLAILIWLGNWQYGRFQQKMALDRQAPDWVVLQGEVVPGSEAIVYGNVPGASAWRRVYGIDTGDAVVFTTVELLFQIDPPEPCRGETCGQGLKFEGEGLFRPAQSESVFTPDTETGSGIYYALQPDIIAQQLVDWGGAAAISDQVFEPRSILLTEAGRSASGANPFAKLRMDDELPPQRHFGYAITWWGLAFALLGVYLAFHHLNGRLRFRTKGGS